MYCTLSLRPQGQLVIALCIPALLGHVETLHDTLTTLGQFGCSLLYSTPVILKAFETGFYALARHEFIMTAQQL
jgi:hypothetical protein